MQAYRCSLSGRCEPDISGKSLEECVEECTSQPYKDLTYLMYEYSPEDAAYDLAGSDRISLIRRITGITVPEEDSARILFLLEQDLPVQLAFYHYLLPYLTQVYPPKDIRRVLIQTGDFELYSLLPELPDLTADEQITASTVALLNLREHDSINPAPDTTLSRLIVNCQDEDALGWLADLYPQEIMHPNKLGYADWRPNLAYYATLRRRNALAVEQTIIRSYEVAQYMVDQGIDLHLVDIPPYEPDIRLARLWYQSLEYVENLEPYLGRLYQTVQQNTNPDVVDLAIAALSRLIPRNTNLQQYIYEKTAVVVDNPQSQILCYTFLSRDLFVDLARTDSRFLLYALKHHQGSREIFLAGVGTLASLNEFTCRYGELSLFHKQIFAIGLLKRHGDFRLYSKLDGYQNLHFWTNFFHIVRDPEFLRWGIREIEEVYLDSIVIRWVSATKTLTQARVVFRVLVDEGRVTHKLIQTIIQTNDVDSLNYFISHGGYYPEIKDLMNVVAPSPDLIALTLSVPEDEEAYVKFFEDTTQHTLNDAIFQVLGL
jgi:hypothetical protein